MAFERVPSFLHSQLFVTPKYPTHDFSKQTVIVTGGNVGLGYDAAQHFVRLNADKVIIAARTASKGEEAKALIEKNTGRQGVVEVWSLDLSKYESVQQFAKKVQELPRIDVVVENAGILTRQFDTSEGTESTICVNVISTFLLALLLLPKLRESGAKFETIPTLTIVSSEVHFFTKLPEKSSKSIFEKLKDEKSADMNNRLLLEILYVRELAAEITKQNQTSRVTINIVNPGLCQSKLPDGGPFYVRLATKLLARTTEVGSRTHVAAAAIGYDSHGKYMSDGIIAKPSKWVRSKEGSDTAKRVYRELNQILNTIQPGILHNI